EAFDRASTAAAALLGRNLDQTGRFASNLTFGCDAHDKTPTGKNTATTLCFTGAAISRRRGAPRGFGDGGPHEFERQARVAVDEVEPHGLAVDDRQRVAQLVPDVAAVTCLDERLNEGQIEVV